MSKMGYTWSELRDEYLADVLYTYAVWEKQEKEKQDEMDNKPKV